MSQIQQIKDAVNIVDIIGERIKLQKAGSNLRANCPFHSERTPSFNVSEQMQRYKCFGCGEGGDVLEFLQKYECMTFIESLRYLAERTGIELDDLQRSQADDERDRLLSILSLAKEYYHYLLTKHQVGEPARQYLKNRGISQESIKLFQIGYSLPSWDGLIKFLHQKKKFSLQDIAKTGLIIANKTGRHYDRFRDRIIFPLKNHRGQVVGFSGRLLSKNPQEAKYINSPETSLYHKSQLLFGYSELFREIKKKNEIIVTEGEFDVISSAQAHVNNIVAIKGSALSPEQIKLFSRVADKVLLALDADEAGIKATKRAIELIKDTNLELRVINLLNANDLVDPKSSSEDQKQAKDPDEIARTDPKKWRSITGKSISVYDFLLNIVLNKHDASTPQDKRKILVEMAPVLSTISLEVERDYYIQKLATALNVKPDIISADMKKILLKQKLGSKNSSQSPENEKSESRSDAPSTQNQNKSSKPLRLLLEEFLLFLLFRTDSDKISTSVNQIKETNFLTHGASQIIKKLIDFRGDYDLEKFAKTLPEDLKQILTDIYLNPRHLSNYDSANLEIEWKTTFKALKKEEQREKIDELNKKIERLDSKNQKTPEEEREMESLLVQIVDLQKKNHD